jgi:hypothetical protein
MLVPVTLLRPEVAEYGAGVDVGLISGICCVVKNKCLDNRSIEEVE